MTNLFRPGATAVISGGASGVGFAMASLFRRHGMHVALLDNNSDNLQAASAALKSLGSSSTHPGVKTETYQLDVGDLAAWQTIKSQISSTFDTVDVLMLNAGTSFKPSTAQQYEDVAYFHKTLNTNMYGVINGLSVFLPLVQAAAAQSPDKQHAVLITGSKQGITNPPGNVAYNMSKSALKTLAEQLAHDLRTTHGPSFSPNTTAHLIIPGWTYTGLSGNAGPAPSEEQLAKKPKGAWLPEQVAEYAERKIREGRFYIVCPDNDVDEALDMARMSYGSADVSEGRSALSRWDDKYKDSAAEWIKGRAEEIRKGK